LYAFKLGDSEMSGPYVVREVQCHQCREGFEKIAQLRKPETGLFGGGGGAEQAKYCGNDLDVQEVV